MASSLACCDGNGGSSPSCAGGAASPSATGRVTGSSAAPNAPSALRWERSFTASTMATMRPRTSTATMAPTMYFSLPSSQLVASIPARCRASGCFSSFLVILSATAGLLL